MNKKIVEPIAIGLSCAAVVGATAWSTVRFLEGFDVAAADNTPPYSITQEATTRPATSSVTLPVTTAPETSTTLPVSLSATTSTVATTTRQNTTTSTAATTAANTTKAEDLLEKYISAVAERRSRGAGAKKTVTTTLYDFSVTPKSFGYILNAKLPGVDVVPVDEMKKLFGQGVKESSGSAAQLRPAVTLGRGDLASLSGGTGKLSFTLSGESNPTVGSGKIGKLTRDFTSAEGLRADLSALTADGDVVINMEKIDVSNGELRLEAEFDRQGRLVREKMVFDFVIRIENMTIGTKSIPKIPGAKLSSGELPGTREIIISYS
jgi:hypothetical protein